MSSYERKEYPCGCYYEKRESAEGELLALRLTTCGVCMSTAWFNMEALDKSRNLELELASPARAETA